MGGVNINDEDLLGPEPVPGAVIEHGTVGWVGDPDVAELGTDANGGITLVKVTLYRGAPKGEPVSAEGGANGHQILAQLSWPFWIVPPKGMRCFVAFPAGLEDAVGAGLIIGCAAASPTKQFSATAAKIDLSGYDLVIKGKSVTLISEDDGARHMVSVSGRGGCQMADGGGSGFFCKDGEATMKTLNSDGKLMASCAATQSAVTILDGAGMGQIKMKSGNVTISGKGCALNASSIALGAKASPATPMCVGMTGMSAVGSSSIFGSP